MGLAAGTRLGTYEILKAAGSGGMGEVYRARDLKLGRDVALKILPTAVSSDAARMARFQQEARVLASLNHPNIGSIYGIEDSQLLALVLEFVEGPTLADTILEGPIPLDEALPIARQIAEALEYAHEKGITHRDLKPANVKLCPDGTVKVLDFGLAKVFTADPASSSDAANSPTFTAMATQEGVILGTAAYMSPEQAKGKTVDRRTDIWAFGCVLFEMLSGRRPFEGETVTDTLAAIVRGEPDWRLIPGSTPQTIVELMRRCLQKDPKQRLQAIGDARIAIDEARLAPASVLSPERALVPPPRSGSKFAWLFGSALVLGLFIAGVAWWIEKPQTPRRVQFEIPIAQSDSTQLQADSLQFEGQSPIAISADGSKLAFTLRHNGISQLYLRSLDSTDPVVVPNTEGSFGPFFSPDDQWIGYFVPGKMMKVPTVGGAPIELCAIGGNPRGASWGKNGFIYLASIATGGLMKVPEAGGTPQPFTELDAKNNERTHRWPSVLPDGKHVIFTVGKLDSPEYYDDSEIDIADTQTGERTLIWKGSSMAKYVPTGQLLYARGGTIYAAPFSVSAKKVSGPSKAVLTGVAGDVSTGAVFVSSGDTDLAVVEGGPMLTNRSNFAWVDQDGRVTNLPAPPHYYRDIQLSPDGTKIAVVFAEKTQDVWIYDIRTDKLARLTYEGLDQYPIWSSDGKTIYYLSSGAGGSYIIKSVPADGSAAPTEIVSSNLSGLVPYSVSPDGATLFATKGSGQGGLLIGVQLKEKDHREWTLMSNDEGWPRISPDGKLMAFVKGTGGYYDIYVEPYPATGAQWQISTEGGIHPVWSKDGKRVYFLDRSANVMMTEIQTSPGFTASNPKLVYRNLYRPGGGINSFSVAPDGKHILIMNPVEGKGAMKILVNLNWVQTLKQPAK
jgi:serine/threonine-protein kinase